MSNDAAEHIAITEPDENLAPAAKHSGPLAATKAGV